MVKTHSGPGARFDQARAGSEETGSVCRSRSGNRTRGDQFGRRHFGRPHPGKPLLQKRVVAHAERLDGGLNRRKHSRFLRHAGGELQRRPLVRRGWRRARGRGRRDAVNAARGEERVGEERERRRQRRRRRRRVTELAERRLQRLPQRVLAGAGRGDLTAGLLRAALLARLRRRGRHEGPAAETREDCGNGRAR